MNRDQHNLFHDAFEAYLLQFNGELEPSENNLSYDFDDIDNYQWNPLADMLVKDELRELTNIMNHWHSALQRWHAWNNVISPYSEEPAWELRHEFLESLAHYCLLMPSAIRDTFTFVVTNSMHQMRLAISTDYLDYLVGDPDNPGQQANYLSRRKKENRLADLVSVWPEAKDFMNSLRLIDDQTYRRATSDYRNLYSHAIGPRLGIGITRTVVRYLRQAFKMMKQPDGTYTETPIPGKMSVCYGFGGIDPLDIEKARIVNLDQYRQARKCYASYRHLLTTGMKSMSLNNRESNPSAADA